MENPAQISVLVVTLGFALGMVFGAIAHKTNFCAMGAVSDVVNMGDWNRMRMWLLAIAVAVVGAGALAATGKVDLSRTVYSVERLTWLSHVVGGLLFGAGMTLASGCGSRNLVRLGGGNLKSFVVVLMLAAVAYMTLKGALAPLRVRVLDAVVIHLPVGQGLPRLLAGALGADLQAMTWLLPAVVGGALAVFVVADRDFRFDRNAWIGGLVIGATVVGGWYVTGHLGHVLEHPDTLEEVYLATNSHRPESLTYVGPVAYTLELGLLWTDTSLRPTFGIATVLGTLAGSFLYAIATRNFRWEGFGSAVDVRNHLVGGFFMGFGGVTALGCTIGQGISGFSTLAIGSILTFTALVAGSAATMKFLYWRMLREPASG
jgi:uncharacterized membrane protein YedE/YeeE